MPVRNLGKGAVEAVPVKPVFFDIAWNFVEYPGEGEERGKVEGGKKVEEAAAAAAAPKKGGFLGGLFGR